MSGSVTGDQQDEITISFDATALTSGFYEATLAIVTDDPGHPLMYLPVQMTVVDATYGVTLNPGSQSQSGWAGTTLTYNVQVNNIGSVPDTYDVTTTGADWEVVLPTAIGPVNPDGQAILNIEVQIPETDVWAGDFDVVRVFVTSQGDSGHSAIATLTSTVSGPYRILLPFIATQTNPESNPYWIRLPLVFNN
jgi:uncharacterized membrane protein